ncbi:MAG: hypothetical protein JJT77_09770 [Crocinitomicaceae bacterium]|nr:hypothetical protein [Crocinitomicaceae bacterium]
MRLLKLYFLFPLLVALFFACSSDDAAKDQAVATKKEKKQFEMYEHSEMAVAMLYFYAHFETLKIAIREDQPLGEPSQQLELFHTAEMTKGKTKDETFLNYLEDFKVSYASLFNDEIQDKSRAFNKTVDACIACHQKKCSGPIPKIEKLYLPESQGF